MVIALASYTTVLQQKAMFTDVLLPPNTPGMLLKENVMNKIKQVALGRTQIDFISIIRPCRQKDIVILILR